MTMYPQKTELCIDNKYTHHTSLASQSVREGNNVPAHEKSATISTPISIAVSSIISKITDRLLLVCESIQGYVQGMSPAGTASTVGPFRYGTTKPKWGSSCTSAPTLCQASGASGFGPTGKQLRTQTVSNL